MTKIQSRLVALLVACIFLPRLLSLGSVLTIDEPLWIDRGHTFLYGLVSGDFSKTFAGGQPGVMTMWVIGLSAPWHTLAAGQAASGIATGLLILLTAYFFSLRWGFRLGLLVGFLLALDPFLLAHSRVAHTDALFALLSLASLAALLAAFTNDKVPIKRYLIASSILIGMALLTKLFAIIVIPLHVATFIFLARSQKTSWRKIFSLLASGLIIVGITTILLWPALWTDTKMVVDYLTKHAGDHVEGTQLDAATSQWWYYLRETFFRSTPITLILATYAIITASWLPSRRLKIDTSLITAQVLLFIFAMSQGGDKSDRYILYGLSLLIVLAGIGLHSVSHLLLQKTLIRASYFVLPLVVLLFLSFSLSSLHPYYLAYTNPLYPVEPTHKLGWGEGLEQAAAWIKSQNPKAHVASYYSRVFSYFYKTGTVDSLTHRESADYVVLYRGMLERDEGSPEADTLREFFDPRHEPPVHTIHINNLPYVWIFKQTPHGV